MSIQVNFFADEADSGRLHSVLRDVINPLFAIKGIRDTKLALKPENVTENAVLYSYPKLLLAPEWALDRIVYHRLDDTQPNQYVVDENVSPMLVYNPSRVQADGTLKIGRIYYAYPKKIPRQYRQSIRRLFSWIREHSVPVPGMRTFRILESASRQAPYLRQWVGLPFPNPLLKSD